MGEVIGEELVPPVLVLPPFRAGQEKRVREGDGRVLVRSDGVDAKRARRLPMRSAALVMLDRAVSEKRAQRFEEAKVAARHCHAEDELQARRAVAIGPALSNRGEATLAGDEVTEREADRPDELEEFREKWRRWGSNPRSSCMPCRRSTRLSYAPGVYQGISGDSRLELIAYRTHVRSLPPGCDIYR